MAKQYNVNIIGNLTNNDGILSGFSASNYAKLNKSFQPSSASWEIVFKINTGNTPSGAIFGNTGFTYQNAPQVGINGNSKFQIYVPANGSQYGGHNIVDGATGTHTVLANTTYWIKLYFTGSEYALDYSLDGETYINDYSYTSSTIMYQPNVTFNIGYNSWNVSSVDFFTGTIDLNESYIKVNGVTWWRGVTNTTTIQLRHDTASNWSTVNPTLADGEVGIETDTRKQKFGDGVTAWNSLPYDKGSTALQSITSSDVTTALGYTPYNSTNPNNYISGITSSDVTTALGYTPVDRSLSNLDSAGQDKFDAKVNKAGDTMTGHLVLDNANFRKKAPFPTSTPSSDTYRHGLEIFGNDTNVGTVAIGYLANGNLITLLQAQREVSGTIKYSTFTVGISSTGNTYCQFPNTTCCDGQWTNTSVQLANFVSLPVGTDQKITYDLSSALPNDNYKYEVVLNYGVQTGNVSGANLYANIIGSDSIWHRICDTYARGSWYMVVGGNVVVTVGTARTITFRYTTTNKAGQLNYLYVEGYKRKGTNE